MSFLSDESASPDGFLSFLGRPDLNQSPQERNPGSQAGVSGSSTQSQSCDSAEELYHREPLSSSALRYLVINIVKELENSTQVNLDLMSSALLCLRQVRTYLDNVEIDQMKSKAAFRQG